MGVIVADEPYYQFNNPMSPPGPALKVKMSDPESDKRRSVLALIDSGADITCISEEKVEELEKTLGYPIMMQSVSIVDSEGEVVEELQTYVICVILENDFPYVPNNGILTRDFGEEDMLIGRDILSSLKVTLDGPNQTFTIEDPEHC